VRAAEVEQVENRLLRRQIGLTVEPVEIVNPASP
jgi:hypothetical protein